MNNALHLAVVDGSIEPVDVLSRGGIRIDERGFNGYTPLVLAALHSDSRVVRTLLDRGADVTIAADTGGTALHMSAKRGHLAATKLLLKAGADLEAATSIEGLTPLCVAAGEGHLGVVVVLIDAGADVNSRALNGTSVLYSAACNGHLDVVKVLLRAGANPLPSYTNPSGHTLNALDVAVMGRHLEVAQELIQLFGIEGCGGVTGGLNALTMAAESQQLEMMVLLTRAGVVDTGLALMGAATCGHESSVNYLLLEWKANGQGAGYPDTRNRNGISPLFASILACRLSCSPRTTRLLVDAGADTTTPIKVSDNEGDVLSNRTPLAFVTGLLRGKTIEGKKATEEQLNSMEGTRRVLMRVDAVRAVSWLWPRDAASADQAAAAEGTCKPKVTSGPLTSMMPILRRRARRPRVLLAALFRWAVMHCCTYLGFLVGTLVPCCLFDIDLLLFGAAFPVYLQGDEEARRRRLGGLC